MATHLDGPRTLGEIVLHEAYTLQHTAPCMNECLVPLRGDGSMSRVATTHTNEVARITRPGLHRSHCNAPRWAAVHMGQNVLDEAKTL